MRIGDLLRGWLGTAPAASVAVARGRGAPAAGDPDGKLLEHRILLVGTPIDDAAAEEAVARLLWCADRDPVAPISLYVNSPGGSVTATLAIHDAMRGLRAPIYTCNVGLAAGTATLLVAAGVAGQRLAVPAARFGFVPFTGGEAADPARRELLARISAATGRGVAELDAAMAASRTLDVREAIAFGLVDAEFDGPPRA